MWSKLHQTNADSSYIWYADGWLDMMHRKDWLLLAIAASGKKGLSPVVMQKVLFLLGKQMPRAVGEGYYTFKPYNYGPFTTEIYTDASQLESDGLIVSVQQAGRSWSQLLLTPAGADVVNHIHETAPKDAISYLEKLVEWAIPLSFQDLVGHVYQLYPDMKQNSVFQG